MTHDTLSRIPYDKTFYACARSNGTHSSNFCLLLHNQFWNPPLIK